MRIYLIIFIFLLAPAAFGSGHYDCPVERCKNHGPEIRFPFRLIKSRQPGHCGYPGFGLYCSHSDETMLDLPFPAIYSSTNLTRLPHSVQLIVKEINYTSQLICLSMLDSCLPGVAILNLSASPFRYSACDGDSRSRCPDDYIFFNCTLSNLTVTSNSMFPVPCLSRSNGQFYAIRGYYPLYDVPLSSCSKMFNISSATLTSSDDHIQLSWESPYCGDCEREGKYCRLKNNGSIHDTECFPREVNIPDPSRKKVIKGVGISLPTMVMLVIALYFIYSYKKKKDDQKRIEQFLEDHKALRPTRYTYTDIKKITNHFKEKLGQGGYGTVYKGKLSNDILVAIKLLDNFKGNGEEFINEVATIGKIHHVNVVRLVGFCADGSRRALVYEFLPNESLQKFISSENQIRSLGWEKLQHIAIGIAKGLDYLHQGCNQRILHFDIKPHNILLDKNFNPKVADFGLAKLCSKEQSMVSMTAARGTVGYIAPEVFSRNYGNVSYKADIYSFGMLLLDMVGGRKNFRDAVRESSEVYFPEWMYNQLEKGEEIAIQIDKEEDNKIVKKLTVTGLWCIQWYPADRPSMKVVIQMIEGDEVPIIPPNPFATTKSSATNASVYRSKFLSTLENISEGE